MSASAPSWMSAPGMAARYAIFDEIASGGMATVHLGRLVGAGGFVRTVAIKRLHPHLVKDKEFASLFLDEARLAARIQSPHVVQTLDVAAVGGELWLVMEYVHGVSLELMFEVAQKSGRRLPPSVVGGILVGVLEGLHAAHEAKDERGEPLNVVHRDVSPQNVIISVEGVPRILDFGVAKAFGQHHLTRQGQLKGKLAYMSPEQVRGDAVTRESDLFSAGVVLWEALVGEHLFSGTNAASLMHQVLEAPIDPPTRRVPELPAALDGVLMCALSRDPAVRFPDARAFATAIEVAVGIASPREIGAWVREMGRELLADRAQLLAEIERRALTSTSTELPAAGRPPSQSGLRERAETEAGIPSTEPAPRIQEIQVRAKVELEQLEPEPESAPPPHLRKRGPPPLPPKKGAPPPPPKGGPPPLPPRKGAPPPAPPQARPPALAMADIASPLAPLVPLTPLAPLAPLAPKGEPEAVPPLYPFPKAPDPAGAAAPPPPTKDEPPPAALPARPPEAPPMALAVASAPKPAGPSATGPTNLADSTAGTARPAPFGKPLDVVDLSQTARPISRPRRLPSDHGEGSSRASQSLRQRLDAPIKVIMAGVVMSAVDWGLRIGTTISLPVRPLWIAELLVIGGTVWAFTRIFLAPKRSED